MMKYLGGRKTKRHFAVLVVVSVILLFQIYKIRFVLPNPNKVYTFNHTGTKVILFYTAMFDSETFYCKRTGYKLFENCEIKNCYATADHDLLPIEEYDALMFHIPQPHWYLHRDVVPSKRSPHQRYIFVNLENPIFYVGRRTQYAYNNFYNWTMTYRLDSDIRWTYGRTVKGATNYTLPEEDFFRNKTRSVAWFVSNCNAFNRRDVLGEKLGRYIDVDVYGKCGTLTCDKTEDCYGMLEKKYFFYLAFENAHCRDYVTEKLFNVLPRNVVPVVYGGGNYSHIAPPHSLINVDDFENVESLANYLKRLRDDLSSYLRYLEWKKEYYLDSAQERHMCDLCRKLNDPNEPPKTYPDIHDWWWSKSNARCKEGENLPSFVW